MDKLMLKVTLAFLVILPGASPNALTEKSGSGVNNRLILNGKVTDENALSWETTGKLSLEALPAETAKTERISFYAYLIRAGKIVDADAFAHNHAVTEVEMSAILKPAKEGDKIIIDPAGEDAGRNRRVIVVRRKRYAPQFNWWPGQYATPKDGC